MPDNHEFPLSQPDDVALELESGETIARGRDSSRAAQEVDLCFVFDTTGSMSDKIEGLVACTVDFVRELAGLDLQWRISVVPFGDLTVPGDRIVGDLPFVSTQSEVEYQLRTMIRNSGGGNLGESSIEAVTAGLEKQYRPHAVEIIILLTDEPALGEERASDLSRELQAREVVAFVVSPDLPYFRDLAVSSGGAWLPIGAAVDMAGILQLLRELASRVALVAHRIHELGGGSVAAYQALSRGETE